MATDYSQEVLAYLRQAGWMEGRRVDPSHQIQLLLSRGYHVVPAASHLIEEFGNLKWDSIQEGPIGFMEFNVESATRFLTSASLGALERLVGECLTPIGIGEEVIVLISESEQVYFLQDQWFGVLQFADFAEALDYVFSGEADYNTIDIPNNILS
jgi:hypothetical protein